MPAIARHPTGERLALSVADLPGQFCRRWTVRKTTKRPRTKHSSRGPHRDRSRLSTKAKRKNVIETAMRHFAEYGYEDAPTEGMARELGISKASIFQYFGTKKRLLLEALKQVGFTHRKYLDAPPQVVRQGFLATVRYWLRWADFLSPEERVHFRLRVVANYATGLDVKREISRKSRTHDPTGALAFVRMGIQRGEVRTDIDAQLLAKTLDLMVNGFVEARFAEELDPGFFRNNGELEDLAPSRVDQYLELIRGALGKR